MSKLHHHNYCQFYQIFFFYSLILCMLRSGGISFNLISNVLHLFRNAIWMFMEFSWFVSIKKCSLFYIVGGVITPSQRNPRRNKCPFYPGLDPLHCKISLRTCNETMEYNIRFFLQCHFNSNSEKEITTSPDTVLQDSIMSINSLNWFLFLL